jgi:pimeloyl-ACP methyl ester carboxylesterase
LKGQLVTYKAGKPVGVDEYHDDGDELSSRVQLGPTKHRIVLSRSKRTVRCDGAPPVVLEQNTVALENGHWQAYAIAAERFVEASEPRPIRMLLPCSGVAIDATIQVTTSGSTRRVVLEIGPLSSHVVIDDRGAVIQASVPAQRLEVRPAGTDASSTAPRSRRAPESVIESAITVSRAGVTLEGTAWIPRRAEGKLPVALIVAGSGPTDRDGNSVLGIHSDAYRLLSAGLSARGVATIRYDKRGAGESRNNSAPESIQFDDLVGDALAWVELIRRDPRFGQLTLVGHSEGGLVETLAAQRTRCDALVLIASPGRSIDVVVRDQLAKQSPASLLGDYDRLVSALRDGRALLSVPEELRPLFDPAGRSFLNSMLGLMPPEELKKVAGCPITIVQGDTDLQISVEDAKLLAAARPDARLRVLSHMNHVLKREEQAALPQASYTDPERPLAPGLVDAVDAGVAR